MGSLSIRNSSFKCLMYTRISYLLSQSPQASLRNPKRLAKAKQTPRLLQLGFLRNEIRKHEILLGIGELKFSVIELSFNLRMFREEVFRLETKKSTHLL